MENDLQFRIPPIRGFWDNLPDFGVAVAKSSLECAKRLVQAPSIVVKECWSDKGWVAEGGGSRNTLHTLIKGTLVAPFFFGYLIAAAFALLIVETIGNLNLLTRPQ